MNKLMVGSVALAAVLAGPAWAADMPVPVKAPVVRPAWNWTGCYAGIGFGFFQGLDRYNAVPDGRYAVAGVTGPAALIPLGAAGIAASSTSYEEKGSAYSYGGQIGCDYQFGAVVVGGKADFHYTALDESVLAVVPADGVFFGFDRTESVSKRVNWYTTALARIGVTPADAFLIYATGGFAAAHYKAQYISGFTDGSAFAGTFNTTRTGWAAGAGVEWGVAPAWTVSFEYLYMDFGTFAFSAPNTSVAGGPADPRFTWTSSIRAHEQTFRVGINYHFGAPVVAKF
jgi:outer membrane immunogenic protein